MKSQLTKKKNVITNKKVKTKKCIIKSEYINDKKKNDILKKSKLNWNLSPKNNDNIDWIHTNHVHQYDRSLWGVKSNIKSTIELLIDNVNNKFVLVENLKNLKNKKLDENLLEQKYLNLFYLNKKLNNNNKEKQIQQILGFYKNIFQNGKVWIFKNIFGSKGQSIFIFSSWKDFCSQVTKIILNKKNQSLWKKLNYQKYKNLTKNKKFGYHIEWVLQEYITNPLLLNKRKFHLRGYLLYHIDSNKKPQSYYFNNYRIFTGLDPYKKDDYYNKKIHDSHFESTLKELNFDPEVQKIIPQNKMSSILKQLKLINKSIVDVIRAKCYAENSSCYHLFASDIMITSDYKCKFIELNNKPGMAPYPNQKVDYQNLIFKSIFHNIIEPTFLNKKVTETEKYHFIKL